jgi:glycosyltransferase involved in cell wall biosynthesis
LVNCKKIKKKGLILWDEEFEWKKSFKRKLIMPLTSFINRNSNYILVPSFKHKEWQLKLGVDEKKVVLFPNVANLTPKMTNNEKVNEIIEKYNLEGKKIIMYAGQLIPRKGVEYLIDAYYMLINENPKFKEKTTLMIIGGGYLKKELEKKAKKIKNIGGKVIFTGKIKNEELPNYYYLAHIGIVPSININGEAEPHALVLNEFMVF